MRPRQCLAIVGHAVSSVCLLVALSNSAFSQSLPVPPPIPSGPPLELPASATRPFLDGPDEPIQILPPSHTQPGKGSTAEWLQEDPEIVPVGFLPLLHHSHGEGIIMERPPHPTPPPANFAGSNCDINPWCGNNIFSPDFHSYQVLAGFYASSSLGPDIPAFNFAPVTIRKGWMLTAPDESGSIFHGNWECLAGLSVAPITSSYGHIAASPTVHLRRNFVSTGASVVPYSQLGLGLFLTDAYKDKTQRAIGQGCEFTLQAHVGVRFFLASNLSLDVEAGYQHISNGNQSSRNLGVNALGAQLGLTYHLPWGAK